MSEKPNSEFSYFVNIDDVSSKEKHHKLEASQVECDALATRFGLSGLEGLRAHLVMRDKGRNTGITLVGKLFAVAYQGGGQNTAAEKTVVDDDINIRFLPEDRITPEVEEENMMTLDSEDLEPMPDDRFDLGELMAQYVALSVDPYLSEDFIVSKEDLGPGVSLNEPELKKPNPFAVLSGLKDKLQED